MQQVVRVEIQAQQQQVLMDLVTQATVATVLSLVLVLV
jgi:hypothetical protein